MAKRPIGIDLFAGVGGMSLGFEQAGFDVAAAVEIDPVHSACHLYNFPHCVVLPRSVAGLTGAALRTRAGLGRTPIDVVFGGAPCQGFSMIGQRALDDPRNGLVNDFVRLVAELEAKTFVFENVKGLTVGRHRQFLDELIRAFEAAGYRVRQPWQVLNAAQHGVPQDRERLILLGARRDAVLPEYPASTTCRADRPRLGLTPGPTCWEALRDLPDAERFPALLAGDSVALPRGRTPSPYASALRCRSPEDWHAGIPRQWDERLLTSSMRTDHSEISRRRFAATAEGAVEPISRFLRLPRTGVANTLRAGTDSARGAFTSPRPIHYEFPRCITVREMARLHGYPDWFRLHATKWHGARQVGNSVPPPLARAIAAAVHAALGHSPPPRAAAIPLGDPALLTFDISAAAAFWNVAAPNGRRDRKSGARKRKQADIEAERLQMENHEDGKEEDNVAKKQPLRRDRQQNLF